MTYLGRIRQSVLCVAVLVAFWAAYISLFQVPAFLLPSPTAVLDALVTATVNGELLGHLAYTLGNLTLGFVLGTLLGMTAGLLLARFQRLERWFSGPILFLQTAPKIALAPLFVIWFGLGLASKIALIVSLVVFPVMIGTLVGIRSLDPRLRDLAVLLRLNAWQRFRRIELPSALPEIFVGLRVGAVQAVVGAILAEWMSGRRGLGYLMTFAAATYKTPLLFASVLLTALLGIVVYQVVDVAERRLLSWRDDR